MAQQCQGRCGEVQAIATAATGLACFIFRFLRRPHHDGIDCGHVIGWLRLRRVLGDDAGLVDPETARYWHERLGAPPRFPGPHWARRVRAVARDAEPLGFGLSPRLVAAFGAHPVLAHDYLRCATFKAWMVAADDPELAELPAPPPSPWPVPDDARARASSVPPLQ